MLDLFKKRAQDRQEPETRGKKVYAIIPAAGSSRRMGGGNKLVMELGGQPILCRTLRVFNACDAIDGIVLVCLRCVQTGILTKWQRLSRAVRRVSIPCSTACLPAERKSAMLPFMMRRVR